MSYKLTQRTKDALARELIEPNLVLVIDGALKKYAVRIAKQQITYDSGLFYDAPGLFYDGLIERQDTEDLISLSGTTTSISQQLEPDKGAASSTQTLTLKLIDRNEQITQLASPGVVMPDVLYQDARLYFGLYETAFPDDYIEIFNGKVMAVNPKVGTIDFVITHPDDVKRSSIYEKQETELFAAVDFDSATIQSIFYQKRSDVIGTVTVTYTTGTTGDNAIVTVSGNNISVDLDPLITTAKTVKKKIEAHEDASQLVAMKITGTPTTVQTGQSPVTLSSDTEIEVNSVAGFIEPTALLKTYLRIGDEIIEYTGIDVGANKFTGCTRQALTSFGSTHDAGDQVSSFYKYGDATDSSNAIFLALYLLLSGSGVYLTADSEGVNTVPGVGIVSNSMYLPGIFLIRDHNVTVGDLVSSTGPTPANQFTDRAVSFVAETSGGSYIIVDSVTLVSELTGVYALTFKSQFDVLPEGAGLLPSQVDIAQFLKIRNTYSTQVASYEFYFKDTVNTKDFINKQLFLPSGLYSVPRKGKISVGITAPPLFEADSKTLNLSNVKDPENLGLDRSVNNNFYNAIVYKYNPDSVEEIFLNKNIDVSADSSNRIGAQSKVFLLESEGLRPSVDTTQLIERNSQAFLNRYKYGAEQIKVNTLFKVGFGIEVGDAVLFGDSSFQLADTTKGSKDFSPRIMEVTNKAWNWKTGEISLTLLDTTYSSEVRVGVFSPSSIIGTGSTTSALMIVKSFGTTALQREKDKWDNYIGREILVHSEDWSVQGITYIQGFDPGNDNKMLVDPPLAFSPTADYQIDIVGYEEVDELESFYKNAHCFWDHQVDVVSGVSNTELEVGAGDIGKFFVGSLIQIHNEDYSINTTGLKVLAISGNNITFDDAGFIADNSMKIDLIGFSSDEGKPYVYT